MTRNEVLADLSRIDVVLSALWAPADSDPKGRPEFLDDPDTGHLTVNDVIRGQRALNRLIRFSAKDQDPT